MTLKIPDRRARDIIISSIRARSLSNEELFNQGIELIKFMEEVMTSIDNRDDIHE